jgi:hypothetical protein
MPAPTVQAVGAVPTAATTAITPAFPTPIAANDILIGVGESAGAETYPSVATNGFAHVTGSPVTQDSQTTLTVVWARYDGVMTAHSWGDSGNHNFGRYIAIRGCPTSGNPWDVVTTAVESVSDTSASWPNPLDTTVVDTLVLLAIATGTDIATAQVGAVTNAALASITEQMDNWTTIGTGGGYGLVTGTKATIGPIGSSTCTITTAATKAFMTLALKPEIVVPSALPTLVMPPL